MSFILHFYSTTWSGSSKLMVYDATDSKEIKFQGRYPAYGFG
jgi:hypothetical protein